ncbi:mechanosensitive ion channel family protein [Pontiella agarivorans]|uniref:Mechanosensitive ion channel n=1 Tax=Pontiella agarivorans TaxID=3038953 RepID=A0ABU5MTX0_9BACT|nr:mechanosensitive ion channel domain-containing protein [Pontiella agarivorans]MDZ8117657.1 mechanosensitive ion channel [Pontiella agarivorans]
MNLKLYYLITILLITPGLVWLSIRKLKVLQAEREERLKNQDHAGPVPSPKSQKSIRRQQIKRMENRFSITRWTMVLTIFMAGAIFAAAPFIRKVSPTFLPVIMGVVSVIIGIAAKPFIENMICGLVLCHSKLARIGDVTLVDDAYGVIEDVTLTHSIIKRWDSLRYVVPNSSMMTKEFVNYSLHDNDRWVIVEFWIDYQSDISEVEQIAIETPKKSRYFADKEEPGFWVIDTEKAGVKCMITAWATSPSEGWMLGHDIRKSLLVKLKEHGITTHAHRLRTEPQPQEKTA